MVAYQAGRPEIAIELIRQSIALDANNPAAHVNLAAALITNGRTKDAIAHCQRAIQLKPDFADAHYNLGKALSEDGQLDAAIPSYQNAIRFQPSLASAHNNLGVALIKKGLLDEAVASCRRAIELRPDFVDAYNNLGSALRDQGRSEEATAVLRRALELQPNYAEAHTNIGNLFSDQGLFDQAEAAYRRALELKANHEGAKFGQATLALLRGDFERGWSGYEGRWEAFGLGRRAFAQPIWDGRPLDGRTILLHAEQGLGDTLQFVRYAPMVAAHGGRVILECQPALKDLLANVEGVDQTVARGDPLPAFDVHCPLMSLPLVFGTRVETIPCAIPYLAADATRVGQWRERLRQALERSDGDAVSRRGALKVGLVWAGGTRPELRDSHRVDRIRSISLSQLAPVAKLPGVVFVSLQKGPPAVQARTPPDGMSLVDWTDELHDFADAAALVETLDLVITVDTAIAHLAGALGKPVWLLNRYATCWRWMLDREDSPWYPTMRIFRQPKPGDWDSVMERVAEELQTKVGDS